MLLLTEIAILGLFVWLVRTRTASGADFRAINPKGYVPALELSDGRVVTEGAAILLISEDLDEAVGLSDRLQAISKGRLSEPIRAEEVDARRLGLMMAGVWETRDAV